MARSETKRVTVRDVARQSGVSYQTVSRVINNHPYVSKDVRKRVLDVIEELGYRPSRAARNLSGKHSCTIAVVTCGVTSHGLAQITDSIGDAAKELEYDILYSNVNCSQMDQLKDAFWRLGDYVVDGIVTIIPVVGSEYERLVALCGDIPIVQVDAQLGARSPSVVIDHGYGFRKLVQYLVDEGHISIAEIRGPDNWFSAKARHDACVSVLEAAGVSNELSLEGDWTPKNGYQLTKQLLKMGKTFSALAAANDQMALGSMLALYEHGLRIPDDVSVVGFDNIPETAFFYPPLTTVSVDYCMLGKQVLEYLIERIGHPDTPIQQRVVYPELVVRSSTKTLKPQPTVRHS